jgi:hypothetical protein
MVGCCGVTSIVEGTGLLEAIARDGIHNAQSITESCSQEHPGVVLFAEQSANNAGILLDKHAAPTSLTPCQRLTCSNAKRFVYINQRLCRCAQHSLRCKLLMLQLSISCTGNVAIEMPYHTSYLPDASCFRKTQCANFGIYPRVLDFFTDVLPKAGSQV